MLGWAILFLAIGLIAGILGFTGIAGVFIGLAKFVFFAGLILFVVLLVLGFTIFKKLT